MKPEDVKEMPHAIPTGHEADYSHGEIPEDMPEQEHQPNFMERTAAKFASFMRWLGSVSVRANVKRRRGESALTASKRRKASRKGRVRLGRPRGPGTIHAKADGLQLARMGKFQDAAEMLSQQFPELAARYRRFSQPGHEADVLVNYNPRRFVP